jgi:hypothetical protein
VQIFNLDENMILETVSNALDEVGAQVSEEQFNKIADAIDEGLDGVVKILTYGTQENWRQEARDSGTGWGDKYARAIKAKVTGMTGVVYVDENMVDKNSNKPNIMYANMVEQGVKSWSIKDALLASEKAKTSSDGIKYIVVPFPVATPRQPGSSGKGLSKFGGREMTKMAHDIVKNGGKFTGTLASGGEATGLQQYVTAKHHEQYGTFICVSEKSRGWIYPGRGPSPVLPKVLQEVNKQIHQVLQEFISSIVREYTS